MLGISLSQVLSIGVFATTTRFATVADIYETFSIFELLKKVNFYMNEWISLYIFRNIYIYIIYSCSYTSHKSMLVVYQGCCNNDAFYFILLTTVLKLSQMGGSYELKKTQAMGLRFQCSINNRWPKIVER